MKDQFIELTDHDLANVSGGFLGALLGLAGPIMNLVGGLVGKKKEKQQSGDGDQLAAATAERDAAAKQLASAQGGQPARVATNNMMGEGAVPQRSA